MCRYVQAWHLCLSRHVHVSGMSCIQRMCHACLCVCIGVPKHLSAHVRAFQITMLSIHLAAHALTHPARATKTAIIVIAFTSVATLSDVAHASLYVA